ncbi:MAG: rhodanese-like domain-containing protein [Actinomycetota bacterium]|nr:rhodanese-like domain-containing protein [Actinomycetota bacterium]
MRRKSYRAFNLINLVFLIFVVISIVVCAGCRISERKAKTGDSEKLNVDVYDENKEKEDREDEVEEIEEDDGEEIKEEEAKEEMPEVIYITPEEVYEILNSSQSSNYIILDVRTAGEFKEGYIEGAVNIPVSELESRLDELSRDKSIIVYCRSGSRSRSAADILVKNGFTHVYNMGGIVSWINSDYPVVNSE